MLPSATGPGTRPGEQELRGSEPLPPEAPAGDAKRKAQGAVAEGLVDVRADAAARSRVLGAPPAGSVPSGTRHGARSRGGGHRGREQLGSSWRGRPGTFPSGPVQCDRLHGIVLTMTGLGCSTSPLCP